MTRRLDSDEKALWNKVVATVKPLHPVIFTAQAKPPNAPPRHAAYPAKQPIPTPHPAPPKTGSGPGLDGHWDRRIKRGGIIPDVSIDLHDSSLTMAYSRLDGALEQAIAQRLKVILLVTGKPRAHDRTSGQGRGAIAAVVRDWLAASRHAQHISAVRTAHPRHGGNGALYIVLKS